MCRVVGIYVRWYGTRTDTKIQTYRTVLCTEFCASVVHDSWGLRQLSISKHAPPQPSPTAAASANRHIVRSARRIFRRPPLGQLPLQRVHSQGDERGDGDTRRHGLARRRARRRRKRTTHCSGCPNALPCLETQPVRQHQIRCRGTLQAASRPQSSWARAKRRRRSAPDSSPSALPCPGNQLIGRSTARCHLDVLTPMHAESSSVCTVMGTGVGKATLGAGV